MEKEKEEKNDVKKKKILSKSDMISLIIFAFIVIVYLISPKVPVITTGLYGQYKEEDNKLVDDLLGGKEVAEERFLAYFHWYNVMHEVGHQIIRYNSDKKFGHMEEERLVNEFAVAYWKYFGEQEKFDLFQSAVNSAVSNVKTPVEGKTYIEYAEENWMKGDFFTFNNYGYVQFNCTADAIKANRQLEDVLKDMGVKEPKMLEKQIIKYDIKDEDFSTKVINDGVENLKKMGVKLPNKIYHNYNKDPNMHMTTWKKNYLWLIYR